MKHLAKRGKRDRASGGQPAPAQAVGQRPTRRERNNAPEEALLIAYLAAHARGHVAAHRWVAAFLHLQAYG